MWWQLVAVIVVSLIAASMAPKQQAQAPQALRDINFPTVEEGTPQAVVFGDVWSSDWTVLAIGNYRTDPIMAST